ncbi:pleiotropic drug resistance ABC transporter [Exidia glandulosa HHB12029]|uniref:Pleiotropic drug resistance ABC transporter n=1 Tax=Exidia glandulosa HHB12029 TaxID=1314781 RepID=A0A165GFB9_EXIGL|nr:pleiotropic drug resistance ABC transporter [Exidia glandulosa HHB12029]
MADSEAQQKHLSIIVEDGGLHQHHAPATTPGEMEEHGRPHTTRARSSSRVNIDHFDPAGVQALERQLTSEHVNRPPSPASSQSSVTLAPGENFDFERTVRHVVRKAEEANIKQRNLGVVFKDLRVVGKGATAAHQQTLGSLFNPATILHNIQAGRHPETRDILSGFEGVVRPGEMLLVLGRPGSGCSTLLKVLANQRYQYHAVEGEVLYDSITPEQLEKHYRGDVLYCPEDDVHFPTLRVEETIKFASTTRVPQKRIDSLTRKDAINRLTEVITTVFGLRHARKTPVGDAAIRGVSGGEKKRVSISEAMVSRARITAWDNSTRGLDASTALEFGRAVRIATDTFNITSVVSLYQASESLYELFDKVCVIYEGRMAYFGPADQARRYFEDMGYEPANRQTTPDFLVAVTDPMGRIPRDPAPTGHPVPRTADDFARYFVESRVGKANTDEVEAYKRDNVGHEHRALEYKHSAREEHATTARKSSPYIVSVWMQTKAVMLRRVQIMRGNMLFTMLNALSFVFQAIIMGTVFYKVPESTSAYFSRGGVLFFAILFGALTAMSEIPSLYAQRPIVHRQMRGAMYHPFVEAVALTLVDMPITFAILVVYSVIIYFMVDLQRTAGQFFIFLLFVYTVSIIMKGWFRAIAAGFKAEASAQAFAGISVLVLSIYTGYTIPKPSVPGALRWITYINPLRYAFEGLITNEFHTLQGTCAGLVPQGPGYEGVQLENQVCPTVGSVPGSNIVDGNRFVNLSYGYSYSNLWMNYGIVVAFGVAFIAALLALTEMNTSLSVETAITLFKRGSRKIQGSSPADAEKGKAPTPSSASDSQAPGISAEAEKALEGAATSSGDVFTWQGLSYTVPVGGGEQRRLLDDVSGFVAPGRLTALMGESGAGKTTLLNVLAQRVDTGVVSGHTFVNGHSVPPDFQAQTGYCQQTDTHLEQSTVREALIFSAKLRQPPEVPIAEKIAYAEKCLKMCGLEEYAEAIVGTLSVEHRKRTTIGVELAAKPRLLLFLDEPTSGLDSQSAWAIMAFLRSLADHGQAILCTIHQPSAELFQVFDRVLLLRKGGQTVYFGDLGTNATTLIQYFERNGSRTCDPKENPAEFMLDVIGAGATAAATQDWHSVWHQSPERQAVQEEIEHVHSEGRSRGAVEATFRSEFATGWFYQVKELLNRLAVSYWRNPTYIMAKFVLSIFGGLFIGFTFFHSKDTQQGTQNKLFAIFMATILSVPLSNQTQVPFINMRNIYEIRERPSRMYSWTALVTAQILVEIPLNMATSAMIFFCWYWTVGFETSRAGFTFLTLVVAFPLYYQTFSQTVAAMSPNVEIAALAFSFLFSFVLTFDGVLQPYRQLGWWKWMYRISPYTYLIEALYGQAIGHQQINCSAVELVTLNPPSGQKCGDYLKAYIGRAGGYVVNGEATSACQFCSTRTTDEFMENNFNIFYHHHWRNLGIVLGFVCLNIFTIYAFTYLFRIRTGPFFKLPGFLRRRRNSNK